VNGFDGHNLIQCYETYLESTARRKQKLLQNQSLVLADEQLRMSQPAKAHRVSALATPTYVWAVRTEKGSNTSRKTPHSSKGKPDSSCRWMEVVMSHCRFFNCFTLFAIVFWGALCVHTFTSIYQNYSYCLAYIKIFILTYRSTYTVTRYFALSKAEAHINQSQCDVCDQCWKRKVILIKSQLCIKQANNMVQFTSVGADNAPQIANIHTVHDIHSYWLTWKCAQNVDPQHAVAGMQATPLGMQSKWSRLGQTIRQTVPFRCSPGWWHWPHTTGV